MCEVKNNIKIWPQKIIENETVVGDNLIWGDNFGKRLFGENGVSGKINVEVTLSLQHGLALPSVPPAKC